jgi:hypothetical protein
MNYNILEARVEFKNNKIERVTVLVDCTSKHLKPLSDLRAYFATVKPLSGSMVIPTDANVSNDLLQEVAATGLETVDRDEIFPKWAIKQKTQR